MKFIPNYKTKDNIFEVYLEKENLTTNKQEPKKNHTNKEITYNQIQVYNTETDRLSVKSIYYNDKKGFYFKGSSSYWTKTQSRYYIDDLIKIEELNNEYTELK